MATRPAPIYANEKTAAALLDMQPAEFLKLVAAEFLPPGRQIAPGIIRWQVDELQRICAGELARPDGGLEL